MLLRLLIYILVPSELISMKFNCLKRFLTNSLTRWLLDAALCRLFLHPAKRDICRNMNE